MENSQFIICSSVVLKPMTYMLLCMLSKTGTQRILQESRVWSRYLGKKRRVMLFLNKLYFIQVVLYHSKADYMHKSHQDLIHLTYEAGGTTSGPVHHNADYKVYAPFELTIFGEEV